MLAKALSAATAAAVEKLYIEDVFSTWLYTGNDTTNTITNGIDLAGEGGLVWTKGRDALGGFNYGHNLFDTERGVRTYLVSSTANGQVTAPAGYSLTSFNSDGFTLGTNYNDENRNLLTLASWTFRKAAKFFDVVTYTGTGVARTVAHNLGSVPGCIIVKRTDSADGWHVWHRNLANNEYLLLNTTGAKSTSTTIWNNTAPTSSVFSLGTDAGGNANGGTYVAYLFAHDAGGFGDSGNDSVVKCGSFTTDGSGNATVDLGWEPQWLMVKDSTNAQNWYVEDSMRGFNLTSRAILFPNLSNAEATGTTAYLAPSSTGFSAVNGQLSASSTYIYIAIRRGPMKTPEDATTVYSTQTYTGNGTNPRTLGSIGFPPDLVHYKMRNNNVSDGNGLATRLLGTGVALVTNSTGAEAFYNTITAYGQDSITTTSSTEINGASSYTYVANFFRRAPGFFDVVAYTGTGSARTVSHNLGVVPEFCIVKRRDSAAFWPAWSSVFTSYQYVALNETSAKYDDGSSNQTFSFTSSDWSIGTTYASVNASGGTYIAYLFASCPGVSKCFNYTGTGTTLQINCGFTSGARLVLIKRTDSTGDWYIWDSARGIISGNDPYLLLNSTAAEVTNTDYIDPYSAGFEISSTAPAAINANGGSYIGLAIA